MQFDKCHRGLTFARLGGRLGGSAIGWRRLPICTDAFAGPWLRAQDRRVLALLSRRCRRRLHHVHASAAFTPTLRSDCGACSNSAPCMQASSCLMRPRQPPPRISGQSTSPCELPERPKQPSCVAGQWPIDSSDRVLQSNSAQHVTHLMGCDQNDRLVAHADVELIFVRVLHVVSVFLGIVGDHGPPVPPVQRRNQDASSRESGARSCCHWEQRLHLALTPPARLLPTTAAQV